MPAPYAPTPTEVATLAAQLKKLFALHRTLPAVARVLNVGVSTLKRRIAFLLELGIDPREGLDVHAGAPIKHGDYVGWRGRGKGGYAKTTTEPERPKKTPSVHRRKKARAAQSSQR